MKSSNPAGRGSKGCGVNRGGCSHGCEDLTGEVECTCPRGLALRQDQKTCADVDECQDASLCTHRCKNTWGSYQCLCNQGYQLGTDQKSCFSK